MKNYTYLYVIFLLFSSCKDFRQGVGGSYVGKDDYKFNCSLYDNYNIFQKNVALVTFEGEKIKSKSQYQIQKRNNGSLRFNGDISFGYLTDIHCSKYQLPLDKIEGMWRCRIDREEMNLSISKSGSCIFHDFYKKL